MHTCTTCKLSLRYWPLLKTIICRNAVTCNRRYESTIFMCHWWKNRREHVLTFGLSTVIFFYMVNNSKMHIIWESRMSWARKITALNSNIICRFLNLFEFISKLHRHLLQCYASQNTTPQPTNAIQLFAVKLHSFAAEYFS